MDASLRVSQISRGLRVGGYFMGSRIVPADNTPGPFGFGNAAAWHLYGPGGGSLNPGLGAGVAPRANGFHCVTAGTGANGTSATAGFQCPAAGSGWGEYVKWDELAPGIDLDAEYAQWNDSVFSTGDSGYQINVSWDLGTLLRIGHDLKLETGYLYFGQNFYPPYGGTDADAFANDFLYPGNAQGFTTALRFSPAERWKIYGALFTGSSVSNGQSLLTYEAGVVYALAEEAKITFLVRELRINTVQQSLIYRAQIDYSF